MAFQRTLSEAGRKLAVSISSAPQEQWANWRKSHPDTGMVVDAGENAEQTPPPETGDGAAYPACSAIGNWRSNGPSFRIVMRSSKRPRPSFRRGMYFAKDL